MILLLRIIAMAIIGRAAGGGVGAHLLNKKGKIDPAIGKDLGGIMPVGLTFLPEITLAMMIGFSAHDGFTALVAAGVAWAGIEIGTGAWYTMGRNPSIAKGRKNKLSYLVDPVCRAMGWEIGGVQYSWLFGGLKGLIIGLAFMPFGLLLAVLFPAVYEAAWRLRGRLPLYPTAAAEYGSFGMVAVILAANDLLRHFMP